MVFLSGIIPARAGFTTRTPKATAPGPDHPRSRGVYPAPPARSPPDPGSSPLARGLPRLVADDVRDEGIIPARAGFTTPWTGSDSSGKDHPRSRGVYIADAFSLLKEQGSSPLARGLPSFTWDADGRPGIIPARAGFTRQEPPIWRPGADHPRSRGVYCTRARCRRCRGGSSPLARGLLFDSPEDGRANRIIPARAGFTTTTAASCPRAWDHPRSRGVYKYAAG